MPSFAEELRILDLRAALDPFKEDERNRLALFVEKANEIAALSFFQSGPPTWSFTMPEDGEPFYKLGPEITREKVNAVLVPLRLLWSRDNNVSFAKTCELIVAHTTAHAPGRKLADVIDRFRAEAAARAFDDQQIQFQREDGFIPGKEIFEDWLNGEYLHDDEVRRARIEPYRFDGAHEFTFLGTVWTLGRYYSAFSTLVVEPILALD